MTAEEPDGAAHDTVDLIEELRAKLADLNRRYGRAITRLGLLWGWAQEANRRLEYEVMDTEYVQLQFGGNPYANPIFKLVRAELEGYGGQEAPKETPRETPREGG